MLQYEELRLKLKKLEAPIQELADALGLKALNKEIEELELKAAQEEFWNDIENSQKVLQRTAMLKGKVEKYNKLCEDYEDTMTLIELADDEGDESMVDECTEAVERVIAELDSQTLSTLLTGEYDSKNAILTFHAGSGGQDVNIFECALHSNYIKKEPLKWKTK